MKHHPFLCMLLLLSSVVATASAQIKPTYWWQCDSGNATLNYCPARQFIDTDYLDIDSVPSSKDYTIISVYKSLDDTIESSVWRLLFNDSLHNGLTTQQIILDSSKIRYSAENRMVPTINTLQQTVLHIDSLPPYCQLHIGATEDTSEHIVLSELMYFDRHIPHAKLRSVQSYLAVKYGVTLNSASYYDGQGTCIWNHKQNRPYHHRIAGVGNDSVYGLRHLRSHSEYESSFITILADSMQEGGYCLWGDNDGPLAFEESDGIYFMQRDWKIQQTQRNSLVGSTNYSIVAEVGMLPPDYDSLVLIIDGFPFFPDSVCAGHAYYHNLHFPSDTSHFTFAAGQDLWILAKANAKSVHADNAAEKINENGTRVQGIIYPNPTTGQYRITVQGTKNAEVSIYNALGSIVANYSDRDKSVYDFSGELPAGSIYYVTISTDNGTQTTKLIVK